MKKHKLFENFDDNRLGGKINRLVIATKEGDDLRWGKVAFVLFVFLAALYAVGILGVVYLLPYFPTPNTEKIFDEYDAEESIVGAIENTIPQVKKWYRSIAGTPLLPARSSLNCFDNNSCIVYFSEQFQAHVPKTSPAFIRMVLNNMGSEMMSHPLILKALNHLLTEPQDLAVMFQEIERCVSSSSSLSAIACVVKEHLQTDLNDYDQRTVYRYLINMGAVLETLTIKMKSDVALLTTVVEIATTSRLRDFKDFVLKTYEGNEEKSKFLTDKYNSVMFILQNVAKSKASNIYEGSDMSLPLNIFEAVKLDLDIGHNSNAKVGIALAATGAQIYPYVQDNVYRRAVGREWADAYIAWNIAFVAGSQSNMAIPKLLIPSIICSPVDNPDLFIEHRVISLALTLMHLYEDRPSSNLLGLYQAPREEMDFLSKNARENGSDGLFAARYVLSEAMGSSNIKHTELGTPSKDTIEKLFYRIRGTFCHDKAVTITDTNFISTLDHEDFLVYMGFVIWITVVATGIGLEMFFIYFFASNGWKHEYEAAWRFAQYLFPLLAITTLGLAIHKDFLALIFLVIGLWKFGFPETSCSMYMAMYDNSLTTRQRICEGLNSFGAVAHRSAASLLICMLLVGAAAPHQSVVDPILILSMQHLFVLLPHVHRNMYILIEIVLEIFFEWSILSNYEQYVRNHWTVVLSASIMLFAHWLHVTAGAISMRST